MKILYSIHSRSRVKSDTRDSGLFHNGSHEEIYNPCLDYPIYYRVRVQICLLRCIWVTVWSGTVNIRDKEGMEAVDKRARELSDSLSCTGI